MMWTHVMMALKRRTVNAVGADWQEQAPNIVEAQRSAVTCKNYASTMGPCRVALARNQEAQLPTGQVGRLTGVVVEPRGAGITAAPKGAGFAGLRCPVRP